MEEYIHIPKLFQTYLKVFLWLKQVPKRSFSFNICVHIDKTCSSLEKLTWLCGKNIYLLNKFTNSCVNSVLLTSNFKRYFINWNSALKGGIKISQGNSQQMGIRIWINTPAHRCSGGQFWKPFCRLRRRWRGPILRGDLGNAPLCQLSLLLQLIPSCVHSGSLGIASPKTACT